MWHTGDGMGWWMLWGGLMMLLFWGGIIFLIVWVVQSLAHRDGGETRPPSTPARPAPEEIVKERYARGEINRDEFERMMRDLKQT
jgi:putative membrane protein